MNDITVIIPIHVWEEKDKELMTNAINSVVECQKEYKNGKLDLCIVSASNIYNDINSFMKEHKFKVKSYNVLENKGETDFCSQINFAVDNIKTEYFSILEYDDRYFSKWFKQASEYYYGNEDVSLFLPINIMHNEEKTEWQFINAAALSAGFADEIGYINYDALEVYDNFNVTGGIFNTSDFITIGKYKPSIKMSFNYELLLRMTLKKLKVYVVPKEGYEHVINRKGSLFNIYSETIERSDASKWFDLAKRECMYTTDRNKTITNTKEEELK